MTAADKRRLYLGFFTVGILFVIAMSIATLLLRADDTWFRWYLALKIWMLSLILASRIARFRRR